MSWIQEHIKISQTDWTDQGPNEHHEQHLYMLGPPPTSCLVLFDWCGLTYTLVCLFHAELFGPATVLV